jgi:hypothetical protein
MDVMEKKIIPYHEEYYLLGYNVMLLVDIQQTFRRNISSPSLWWENKHSKKPGRNQVANSRKQSHLLSP